MSNRIFSSYQLIHLMKLRVNGLNSLLITDGVGVGKTISAGYILYYFANIVRQPCLIVCPPILVDKWRWELKNRFNLDSRLATNRDEFDLMCDEVRSGTDWVSAPIYISSFSLLSREKEMSMPTMGLLLFDEIHYVRNPETNSYQNARILAGCSHYRVGLSATPINNSLEDMGAIVSVLLPRIGFEAARDVFEDLWNSPTLDSFSGMVTRLLKEEISDQFTRRNIQTEMIEYPDEYMQLVNHLVEGRGGGDASFLEKIIFYRMASSSPRAFLKSLGIPEDELSFADPKMGRLSALLSQRRDERWLIFTEFKETAKMIEESIEDRIAMVLSGDSDYDERKGIVNIFQEEENSILIMTPVGSEGLDFQICSNLVNYDLHWNPMKIEQRIGRIDRIGQKKEEITVHNFVTRGSIDDMVLARIGEKLSIISDSFVDIMSIIESPSNTMSMTNNEALDCELISARDLINASKFYQSFTGSDIDVIKHINPENCDVERWALLDWSQATPWIGNCGSWERKTVENARLFSSLIDAYTDS